MNDLHAFGQVLHLAGKRDREEIDDKTFSTMLCLALREEGVNWLWLATAIRNYGQLVQPDKVTP